MHNKKLIAGWACKVWAAVLSDQQLATADAKAARPVATSQAAGQIAPPAALLASA